METKITNNYKEYLQLLPYVSGLIILISIIKAIIFYNVFGIRIVSYLDLTECILIFLDQLLFILIAMIVTLVFSIYLSRWKHSDKIIAEIESSENPKLAYDETLETLKRKTRIYDLFALGSLLFYSFVQFIKYPIYESVILSLAFGIMMAGLKFAPQILEKTFPLLTHQIVMISLFAILYLGLIINFGLHEAYNIKYGIKNQKVNLTFKSNEIINTSDTLVYIGTTRNYYFFFNPNTMKKTIFMKNELIKLSIQ